MKAKVIKTVDKMVNDRLYEIGEIVQVTELDHFKDVYAVFYNNGEDRCLDYLPRDSVEIIKE